MLSNNFQRLNEIKNELSSSVHGKGHFVFSGANSSLKIRNEAKKLKTNNLNQLLLPQLLLNILKSVIIHKGISKLCFLIGVYLHGNHQ